MHPLFASLPEHFRSDLQRIRTCAAQFDISPPSGPNKLSTDRLALANQSLVNLEQWLLDEEQKQVLSLNPMDVFLLYAAVYLGNLGLAGDIGFQANESGPNHRVPAKIKAAAYDQNPTRRLVLEHWKALGLQDAAVAAAIADVCTQALDDANTTDSTDPPEKHVFDGNVANTALLSAAVHLAEELNPKAPATAARICALLAPGTKLSPEAYDAAFTVKSSGPHPYLTATVRVEIQCRDADIHRALKHHERVVHKKLHRINQVASPRFLFSDVIFEIEADGYTPVDLRFSVDTSAALNLLTGNRLYSDNRVFLRELIQNAVDACNLRKRFERDYQPEISIRFNEDISKVTVRDNGIGMDRQWIEKYFLTIGISLYQSSEVRSSGRRSRIDFNFISQFGIGFLSSFLVADKIVIKTRKPGGTGLLISISNLRDYFDARPLATEFAAGTEVCLYLKPSRINYCRSLEYTGYLKTNLRFLQVPVRFEDHAGKVTTIGGEPLSYENPRTADIDFAAPLAFQHSDGYVLLRAKKNVDHIFALELAHGGVSVFQDGIFVTQLETLLPEAARQNVVGRINLLGMEKCALSMDRNRIFWTDDQLRQIKHTIRMGMADAANQLLSTATDQDIAPHSKRSIINNLSIFFDFNEVDDTIHQRLCQPLRQAVEKKFRNFVRIHFAHTYRSEAIPEADGYSSIWQQRIVESFRKK